MRKWSWFGRPDLAGVRQAEDVDLVVASASAPAEHFLGGLGMGSSGFLWRAWPLRGGSRTEAPLREATPAPGICNGRDVRAPGRPPRAPRWHILRDPARSPRHGSAAHRQGVACPPVAPSPARRRRTSRLPCTRAIPGMPLDLVVGARRAGQPQRRRAPGGHPPHAPHRQEGMAGGLAAPRHHLHGPHDAPGRRHARPRAPALRQGARRRSGTTCSTRSAPSGCGITVGAVCVYHALVPAAVEALARLRHPGGRGLDRIPGRPEPLPAAASRRSGRRSRRARTRSTSSSRARMC